ncbi:flavodoxin family protein [Aliikangiella sp. IMCC44653]
MSNTIALFGSSRRNGNTGKLTDWIAKELDFEVVDLASLKILPFDYSHNNKNDDFVSVIETIVKFENIIFASPVYWYSVSAQLKIFIDRLSDLLDVAELKHLGRMLRGKNGFIICTSSSVEVAESFEASIRDTFAYLGMNYRGCIHANCSEGYNEAKYISQVANFKSRVNQSSAT